MQNQVTPVKVDTVIYRCLKAMRDMMEERTSGQSRKNIQKIDMIQFLFSWNSF